MTGPAVPDAAGEQEPDSGLGLGLAAAAGIHCISLPTPFAVGAVNAYLIEDDPLTLVDVGPNFGSALDELDGALRGLGHRLADIELILITHQHIDHIGLLEILGRHSGAEVAAWADLAPYLADYTAAATADDKFALAIMRRHGVPGDVGTALGAVAASYRQFGSGATVDRRLREGDTVPLRDRNLEVVYRPGHSPSDIVFVDTRRGLALGGDHLLSRISSNPLNSRPLSGPPLDVAAGERPHALISYIASLRATRKMDLKVVLGGHGPPVADHVALIDERLSQHERRARKIADLLEPRPQTAYELSRAMWGNVAVTQAFLTLSEVLGHLDLLIADGRVVEDLDGPVTRFSLT